jgi:glycosyltransferase involved in cell wall biosynthesis
MALSDIFCLPSHREGFGSVIIEAAACLVPTIASRIYGITDAVIEEQTGLLFPAGDEDALLAHMITMRENHTLRNQLANAASARALQEFSSNLVTQAMVNYVEQAITSQVS